MSQLSTTISRSASPLSGWDRTPSPVAARMPSLQRDEVLDEYVEDVQGQGNRFCFEGAWLFLTYSQVGILSRRTIEDFFRSVLKADEWRLGREEHADGGKFFYSKYGKRIECFKYSNDYYLALSSRS